jgi:hypothetical protein
MSMLQVNLMHIFLVGPILFGIGYKSPKEYMELYNYLGLLSAIIPFTVRIPWYDITKWRYGEYLRFFHLVVATVLFGWIAYRKDTCPEVVYHILRILGIAIIVVHLYLAITKVIKSI